MDTLPDYRKPRLDTVSVGINPGAYSARVGHCFATPTNRFWPAVRAAGLQDVAVGAETDYRILEHRMGFTALVKRPSHSASELLAREFEEGASAPTAKLERCQPAIVCFHCLMGFRRYLRYAEGVLEQPVLGLRPRTMGRSMVFAVPNPSPANTAYRLADLVEWYVQLRRLRAQLWGS